MLSFFFKAVNQAYYTIAHSNHTMHRIYKIHFLKTLPFLLGILFSFFLFKREAKASHLKNTKERSTQVKRYLVFVTYTNYKELNTACRPSRASQHGKLENNNHLPLSQGMRRLPSPPPPLSLLHTQFSTS